MLKFLCLISFNLCVSLCSKLCLIILKVWSHYAPHSFSCYKFFHITTYSQSMYLIMLLLSHCSVVVSHYALNSV